MRSRFISGFVLVATLFVAACADESRPTAPPVGDVLLSQSQLPDNAPDECTAASAAIIAMGAGKPAQNLFREGVAFFYTKGQPDQGWKKFIDVVKHLSKNRGSDDPELVAVTILLYQCAGVDVLDNPEGNDDFFVGLILNPNQVHEFISSKNDFLGYFPANFFLGPVIVLGTRQLDQTQVNDEDLQEYPLKVDITAAPPGLENTSGIMAIVKVCAYESDGEGGLDHEGEFSPEDLVLFQQDVGVLTKPDPDPSSGLPCNDTDALEPPPVVDLVFTGFTDRVFAASMRALRGAGGLALSVITPRQVFASSMFVDGGVGGFTFSFSSLFAPVEDSGCEECVSSSRRGTGKPMAPAQDGAAFKGLEDRAKVKK